MARRKMRAQRTVPRPQGPKGGSASSRSGKIAGAEDCAPPTRFPWEGPRPRGPQELAGTGDCAPPGESPNRRQPSPFARSGGTVSSRSARVSGTEDCAPPGGRSPARFFRSSRTATLQGGLSCSMKGARWSVPLRGNRQIEGTLRPLAAWEGPRPRGPQEYRARWAMPLPRHSHGAGDRAESAKPG
jgi:hypothetical protein